MTSDRLREAAEGVVSADDKDPMPKGWLMHSRIADLRAALAATEAPAATERERPLETDDPDGLAARVTAGMSLLPFCRVTMRPATAGPDWPYCVIHDRDPSECRDERAALAAATSPSPAPLDEQWWVERFVAAFQSSPTSHKAFIEMTRRANELGRATPTATPEDPRE